MNKFTKMKLTAEMLEAAVEAVRSTALDKVRWNDEYHLECTDRWDDAELIAKLTPAGSEVLNVAEQLVARIEGIV